MTTLRNIGIGLLVIIVIVAIGIAILMRGTSATLSVDEVSGTDPTLVEPDEGLFPTIDVAEPVGWAKGEVPGAAKGLQVQRFAEGLDHPRIMYRLPNGDILVTLTNSPPRDVGGIEGFIMKRLMGKAGAGEPSPNKLVLLRDTNGDGRADIKKVVREAGLDSPSGLAYRDGTLYVANHNALLAFEYELGSTQISGKPRKLLDLPGGGNHWMRNIVLSPDGENLYIAVGSATNIGDDGMETEEGRATIWEYDLESGSARPYATGLRNPNGLAWNPMSGELWTTVNERDMLGGDLVPDYLTNVPIGANYGWPWVYYKNTIDRRVKAPMPNFLTEYARYPEYALGPHVAALGLAFTGEGNRMGEQFARGAFIARHGSWNRKPPSGYDVVFVRFDERGNPTGKPIKVLDSFLDGDGETRGRPTWVEWADDGSLLISDDTAGIIWRVVAPGAKPTPAVKRIKGDSLEPQTELKGDPRDAFTDEFAREFNPMGN
ncbi:MAG: sorbosone dehydrogenase [Citromicrobium sp.]|nr:sorbosone dehydrogenase [Citromicrobium sp.]MAO95267.1 sorbosone dehydrogenase [Citromicrobium sp.]MAS85127.1 sorbosone dehydrogenase [Erythrobacteraceae bacterium]MBD76073.1 sorbosone dehydrogenase [Citromicrobium sp.]MBT45672.1 sorbosone dehydrogenase [Citromicrobium sp.]|tara:strand:- start:4229 stop:5692 length:1464 start_codon:yes stop_codon:yes gene_type:complete